MRYSWAFRYRLIREGIYQSLAKLKPEAAGRVLDIGCGHKPYRGLFPDSCYMGIDIPGGRGEGSEPDAQASAEALPFAGGSFDCVVCTEVLEHLPGPETAMREMARVLRPGGCLLLSAPFIWPVHEGPRDFCRFTRFGLELAAKRAGLEVTGRVKRGGFWTVIVQLASDHWYPRGRKNRLLTAVGDRLWGLAQMAARRLDRGSDDEKYALGWTIRAEKK